MNKMIGPFTIELKIHVRNDEDGATGEIAYTCPPGRLPALEGLHAAIGESIKQLPEGWRLLDSDEFFNQVLVKKKTGRGGNFAVPDSFSYDVEALAAAAGVVHVPRVRKMQRSCRHEEEE